MENSYLTFNEIKKIYTDEWILLGNPEMNNSSVKGGIVLFHSKDKREVCYIGREKTAHYSTVTIVFAGNMKQQHKIGILKRI